MELKLDSKGRVLQGLQDDLADPVRFATAIRNSLREQVSTETDARIAQFAEIFSRQYPATDEIGRAQALTYGLGMLQDVLALYLLGRNAAVYSELHAWLERTVLDVLPRVITPDQARAAVVSSLIDRRTLGDLCPALEQLTVLNASDVRFIVDLKRIRDGVAHKNADLISRYVASGHAIGLSAISSVVDDRDSAEAIVRSLHLLVKLSWAASHPPGSEWGAPAV